VIDIIQILHAIIQKRKSDPSGSNSDPPSQSENSDHDLNGNVDQISFSGIAGIGISSAWEKVESLRQKIAGSV
jgi:hypothetical protein